MVIRYVSQGQERVETRTHINLGMAISVSEITSKSRRLSIRLVSSYDRAGCWGSQGKGNDKGSVTIVMSDTHYKAHTGKD
jgi:hypothetical protein